MSRSITILPLDRIYKDLVSSLNRVSGSNSLRSTERNSHSVLVVERCHVPEWPHCDMICIVMY